MSQKNLWVKNPGVWHCNVCLVENDISVSTCVCCGSRTKLDLSAQAKEAADAAAAAAKAAAKAAGLAEEVLDVGRLGDPAYVLSAWRAMVVKASVGKGGSKGSAADVLKTLLTVPLGRPVHPASLLFQVGLI